jgi:hypothetical protein
MTTIDDSLTITDLSAALAGQGWVRTRPDLIW